MHSSSEKRKERDSYFCRVRFVNVHKCVRGSGARWAQFTIPRRRKKMSITLDRNFKLIFLRNFK